MSESNFTLDDFEQWLQNKSSDVPVGRGRRVCWCPIAMFLTEYLRAPINVTVTLYSYEYETLDGTMFHQELPKWASTFIVAADSQRYFDDITAKQALDILIPIKRQL